MLEKANEENRKINVKEGPERFMPEQEPPWDPNIDGGKMLVKPYQQLILYGTVENTLWPIT